MAPLARGLRTFWTKPVEDLEVYADDGSWRFYVSWRTRRSCKRVLIVVSDDPSVGPSAGVKGGARRICRRVFIATLELDRELYDARSVVDVYATNSKLLESNRDVEVEARGDASEEVLQKVEEVQRRSWGLYMPPPEGDVVFLARLRGELVSSAYYNPRSDNVDYGIYAVREHWRRRIGTSLLHEVKAYVEDVDRGWFTIIRVSGKSTAADRRAMAFYEANDPAIKLNAYRLKTLNRSRRQ